MSGKKIETLFQSLNAELEKTKVWLKINKLSLKTLKTKFYLLHSLKKTIEIPENCPLFMINKIAVKPAKITKFLGIFLDQNISWKPHIDKICSNLSESTGILYQDGIIRSKSLVKQLYFSYINNYFFMSPSENTARVINFKDKFYHAKPLLEEMKVVTVYHPVYQHLPDTHFYVQL